MRPCAYTQLSYTIVLYSYTKRKGAEMVGRKRYTYCQSHGEPQDHLQPWAVLRTVSRRQHLRRCGRRTRRHVSRSRSATGLPDIDLEPVDHRVLDARVLMVVEYRPTGKDIPRA